MKRRVVAALAVAGLSACAPAAHAPPASTSPVPAAAASAGSSGAQSPPAVPGQTAVPIRLQGARVGSRYIFVTKQKGNRKVYVLRADSESGQYLGSDTGRSDFVNPHVTFFGSNGLPLVAVAPAGTAVEKDKTVRMSGGVRAKTGDGRTLTADALTYHDETETIDADGNVVMTTPTGERLQGEHAIWNLRSGQIDFQGSSG